MTKQRQLIFRILHESAGHMTAEQIYDAAKKEMPGLAIGTVYRNLKLMSESGDILHVPLPSAPDIYDKTAYHHDHMVCDRCGAVCDFPGNGVAEFLSEQCGEKVVSYELVVHHICDECKNNQN